MVNKVRKRDGRIVDFNKNKIADAIYKAAISVYGEDNDYYLLAAKYAKDVRWLINSKFDEDNIPSVEDIQDIVEQVLIQHKEKDLAKEYIIYRKHRDNIRQMNTKLMKSIKDISVLDPDSMDLKRENANIDSNTAMGMMLKYGSESSKTFTEINLLRPDIRDAHQNGDIHIHDLDFYATGTTTCNQIDLHKLFTNGFSTGHGLIREPSNIISAAALACIAIQCEQNDQHGGQSIPMIDYYLAPYVAKSFIKNLCYIIDIAYGSCNNNISNELNKYYESNKTIINRWEDIINIVSEYLENFSTDYIGKAVLKTDKDTHQAMEALIHNLNSMHSRAGAQVPFSSINFGTDISDEGRMVSRNLLIATDEGLGAGETPIFPISIFKLKSGVSYNPEDPNYDLFKLACKVSAKRLFPNFSNIDATFNNQYYKDGDPNTEVTYMGCRTRVIGNNYDKDRQIVTGRGNLSFTSINLPRIAIEVGKDNIDEFYKLLDSRMKLVFEQLYDRLKVQKMRKVKNYPFLMGQGLWIDSEYLDNEDELGDILNHGTLSVGFIGLAECLVALTGKHHGESESSRKLGYEIVKHMREMCDNKSSETGLNYTLLATPAEGLSGRFVRMDRERYGVINGVTDRDYYTNSFHIPVYYNISAFKKVDIEAPYHELTNAGHISYIELDGDPTKNLEAFESIIRYMHDKNMGYFSINHPVDRDPVCGYTGIINDVCPRCGRHEGEGVSIEKLKELKKIYPGIYIPEY